MHFHEDRHPGPSCQEGGETQSQRAHPALRPETVWASTQIRGLCTPTVVGKAWLYRVSMLDGGGGGVVQGRTKGRPGHAQVVGGWGEIMGMTSALKGSVTK